MRTTGCLGFCPVYTFNGCRTKGFLSNMFKLSRKQYLLSCQSCGDEANVPEADGAAGEGGELQADHHHKLLHGWVSLVSGL
jgi:hypothetical protein